MVARKGKTVAAAVHMIPLGKLYRHFGAGTADGESLEFSEKAQADQGSGAGNLCRCIYAFGTLPAYRGQRLGSRLLGKGIQALRDSKDAYSVICPAETSLFDYYEQEFGYRRYFSVWEFQMDRRTLDENGCLWKNSGMAKLSAADEVQYAMVREQCLKGTPHIVFHPRALELQKQISLLYGGDLFLLETGKGLGCLCAYREDGRLTVKELLLPGMGGWRGSFGEKKMDGSPAQQKEQAPDPQKEMFSAIEALFCFFHASQCFVRVPGPLGMALKEKGFSIEEREFAMLLPLKGQPLLQNEKGYFGFAFD